MTYSEHEPPIERRNRPELIALSPSEYSELYKMLGELMSGGKERKEQVAELFDLMRAHSTEENAVFNKIDGTLGKLLSSYEYAITQLQEYSSRCEDADRSLDARIKSLEADRHKVHGVVKVFGLVSFASSIVAVWQYFKG